MFILSCLLCNINVEIVEIFATGFIGNDTLNGTLSTLYADASI
jgi:hypothetical protein